jgi:hypothetical protein
MAIYKVWAAEYYEDESRFFPHEHEYHGEFIAVSADDLMRQLSAILIDPNACRWELAALPSPPKGEK